MVPALMLHVLDWVLDMLCKKTYGNISITKRYFNEQKCVVGKGKKEVQQKSLHVRSAGIFFMKRNKVFTYENLLQIVLSPLTEPVGTKVLLTIK
jgi:hypothetical protein